MQLTVEKPHDQDLRDFPAWDDMSADAEETRQNMVLLSEACRRGDLENVNQLVTHAMVPISQVDEWQCTPLYLACLCGHMPVVKFLLEHGTCPLLPKVGYTFEPQGFHRNAQRQFPGAVCNPNTFEGERTLFGALTEDIRSLLIEYEFSKAVDMARPFLRFMSTLAEQAGANSADVVFRIHHGEDSVDLPMHRFIVAARSPAWRDALATRWVGTNVVVLEGEEAITPRVLQMVMTYMYTGRVRGNEPEIMTELKEQAVRLRLTDLERKLDDYNKSKAKRLRALDSDPTTTRKLQLDLQTFLNSYMTPGIPYDHLQDLKRASQVTSFCRLSHTDMLVRVDDTLFPCHRAILCGRCEYFNTFLNSSFSDATAKEHYVFPLSDTAPSHALPIHTFSNITSPDQFRILLMFLYTDNCAIPPELLHSTLILADQLLLDQLRSLASVGITQLGNELPPGIDIFTLSRTAMALQIDRLERHCALLFAAHLEDYLLPRPDPFDCNKLDSATAGNDKEGGRERGESVGGMGKSELDLCAEFQSLILESAQSITSRQETDSIPLVDDIRYYLARRFRMLDKNGQLREKVPPASPEIIVSPKDQAGNVLTWEGEEAAYNALLDQLDEVMDMLGIEA